TVLTPAQAELGRIAVGMAQSFNQAHAEGMDLYGDMGGNFFNLGAPKISAHSGNAGGATLTASYGDLAALDGQNLLLKFDGTNWQASRADTGVSVPMTGTGTAADPFVVNGVQFVVGGTPATNDRFLLQPTA
ncbi:MAG: FlgK family flagellar hook-associated protein, partial [Stenotrophomonas sp.]